MSRNARIPIDLSPSPKVSSLDCNVILQTRCDLSGSLHDRPGCYLIQALDHRETYHWLNAMSLRIPAIRCAAIEECSAKISDRNSSLRLCVDLLLKIAQTYWPPSTPAIRLFDYETGRAARNGRSADPLMSGQEMRLPPGSCARPQPEDSCKKAGARRRPLDLQA